MSDENECAVRKERDRNSPLRLGGIAISLIESPGCGSRERPQLPAAPDKAGRSALIPTFRGQASWVRVKSWKRTSWTSLPRRPTKSCDIKPLNCSPQTE